MILKKLWEKAVLFFKDIQIVNRENATDIIEFEVEELENIFALLLFGSFIGMPSPPVYISFELLPVMENEVNLMFERVNLSYDALARLTNVLGEP
ncbi:MAG: hypothetical protein DRP87_05435 [Spirochaetes bacterium]|nr:MAG: hypothetical protein DRP87_05435 [Spirochaetota bacterium]